MEGTIPTEAIIGPNYIGQKGYSAGLHLYLYPWHIRKPATQPHSPASLPESLL